MITIKHMIATTLVLFVPTVYYLGWQTYRHDINATSTVTNILDDVRDGWFDLGHEAQDAVKALRSNLDSIDLSSAREELANIEQDMKNAIGHMDIIEFEKWLVNNTVTGMKDTLAELQAIEWKDAPANITKYVEEHPYETAFYVIETVILFVPGGFWGPVLKAIGFTRLGVRARSIAALLQSKIGARVPARGWFAHLVSAAMGGYGRKLLDGWTRIGVKFAGWLGFLAGRKSG
ncbi:hypothetical protein LTR78_002733 [Recurvomyces mirabilis]|uniref:Uncharacterized protein n=1 Tax=Recurvomyces mirabilis TaxID=574656 RepID=A0AAE0WSX0_9PEZI|nr:hypothetical protein LTR78_002733 [Recurvomyces mirabilis]KAK5159532.1 hypothetical protein LTS14_002674 [Recurvomyces mirabilis]